MRATFNLKLVTANPASQ